MTTLDYLMFSNRQTGKHIVDITIESNKKIIVKSEFLNFYYNYKINNTRIKEK